MSTFGGLVEEIPGISIDRFDGTNLESTIFFLSHCHTDHMVGLNSPNFLNALMRKKHVYLYASPVTVQILKCKFPELAPKLKKLPVNVPTLVVFPYNSQKYLTITVTPLTAGHCPGSVMFLFETDKNVLYTGDYRVSASDLKKYCAFYQQGQLIKIHKMYLDTTFFSTSFLKFPSRQETLNAIVKIIKDWIYKNKRNVIQIQTSATYGSEYLFIEIAKEFNMPIHVNQIAYDFYKHIPDMDKAVTLDSTTTQIHSSCGINYKQICTPQDCPVRTIKPSAIYWRNKNLDQSIVDHENENYRVCCSAHSSFEEIVEFLMFLKPDDVEPNVLPPYGEQRIMLNALSSVMESYKEKEPETCNSDTNFVKSFKIRDRENEKTDSDDEEYDSNLDDLLGSPPRKVVKWDIDD